MSQEQISEKETAQQDTDFMEKASRRISFWGLVAVGGFGVLIALAAVDDHEFTGAGVCLIAAMLAFVALDRIFGRHRRGGRGRWRRHIERRTAPERLNDPPES